MTDFKFPHIDGVVLAAGFSSRADAFKMDLDINGKPVLQRVLDAMCFFCAHVFVVAGFKKERVFRLTEDYPKVTVVENANYADGMFSSVKTGVAAVTAPWFFFSPGDYPLISPGVYLRLLEACFTEAPGGTAAGVYIPVFADRKGHPILINSKLKPALVSEPVDSNLKVFINRTGFTPVPVQDSAILLDIDTPEDYNQALNFQQHQNTDLPFAPQS